MPKDPRLTLGFLYPGHSAEDDYPRLASMLETPVHAEVVHTSVGEDAHRVDALLDLGGADRLAEGARQLGNRGVDAAMWACTSGSFVFGPDGASSQVEAIREHTNSPASSTSFAFVEALRVIGAKRVSVAATYPADVARAFVEFLAAFGIETVVFGSAGIVTAAEVGTLGHENVRSLVAGAGHPDAEAILVPDTALHTAAWLDDLEALAGVPVLTANQVTMFEALRLAGGLAPQSGLGTLFRTQSN